MGPRTPRDPDASPFETSVDAAPANRDRAVRVRRAAAALSVVGAAVIVSFLVGGPLAKAIARTRANALGLTVEISSSSLGFGSVHLRGVSLSAAQVPSIVAEIDRVDV